MYVYIMDAVLQIYSGDYQIHQPITIQKREMRPREAERLTLQVTRHEMSQLRLGSTLSDVTSQCSSRHATLLPILASGLSPHGRCQEHSSSVLFIWPLIQVAQGVTCCPHWASPVAPHLFPTPPK